jgi:predicted nucleic acid-binding protein
MNFFLLDARVLLKRFVLEPGADLVDHLFRRVRRDRLSCSWFAVAEVLASLVRRRRAGRLRRVLFEGALLHLRLDVIESPDFVKHPTDDAVVRSAMPLIERYGLGAADAVQLRLGVVAAAACRAAGDDLVLLTTDPGLLRAARREELVTFNPEAQTEAELDALIGP